MSQLAARDPSAKQHGEGTGAPARDAQGHQPWRTVTEQTQHRRRRWGSNRISKSLTSSVQAEMDGGGGLLRTLPLLSVLLTVIFTESARGQSPGLLRVLRAQLCTVGALPQVTQ